MNPVPPSRWLLLIPAAFVALVVLFAAALRTTDPSAVPSALIGKPAPTVALPPIPNAPSPTGIKADALAGTVTVVNFWASWCAPCHVEHPYLMRLRQAGAARMIGVNYKDTPEAARAFLERRGNPFHAVGFDPDGRAGFEWGVTKVPETFVVDRRGVVIFKLSGAIDADNLADGLLPAIEKARAAPQNSASSPAPASSN
ncbi:MAG: DsbE family thiol:disulfide interchange protein [Hyphomicrobiales bacterium]|nr:DsbE family thiol:disulfide interchange protein [Hyphomicrobiales bacterium]